MSSFAPIDGAPVKPVVQYKPIAPGFIKEGYSATVQVFDHYNTVMIDAGDIVHTSTVLKYDEETGDFETRNTFYRLF